MGRFGGSYEIEVKTGNKKKVEATKGAEEVVGDSTRLDEQAKAKKQAAKAAVAK